MNLVHAAIKCSVHGARVQDNQHVPGVADFRACPAGTGGKITVIFTAFAPRSCRLDGRRASAPPAVSPSRSGTGSSTSVSRAASLHPPSTLRSVIVREWRGGLCDKPLNSCVVLKVGVIMLAGDDDVCDLDDTLPLPDDDDAGTAAGPPEPIVYGGVAAIHAAVAEAGGLFAGHDGHPMHAPEDASTTPAHNLNDTIPPGAEADDALPLQYSTTGPGTGKAVYSTSTPLTGWCNGQTSNTHR